MPIPEAHSILENICQLAINKDEDGLRKFLYESGININTQFGVYNAGMLLAIRKKHETINFLIKKFDLNIDTVDYGYAFAGDRTKLEILKTRGQKGFFILEGYAHGLHHDLVEEAINYCIENRICIQFGAYFTVTDCCYASYWAITGYAKRGYTENVNYFIENKLPWKYVSVGRTQAIKGYAQGGYVDQVNQILGNGYSFRLGAAIEGYAQSGHIEQVNDLIERDDARDSAVIGYLRGGHISQAKQLRERGFANINKAVEHFADINDIDNVNRLIKWGAQIERVVDVFKERGLTKRELLELLALTENRLLFEKITDAFTTPQSIARISNRADSIKNLMREFNLSFYEAESLLISNVEVWSWIMICTKLVESGKINSEIFFHIATILTDCPSEKIQTINSNFSIFSSVLENTYKNSSPVNDEESFLKATAVEVIKFMR